MRRWIISETVRLRKNGERVHLSVSISPILDNAGHIIGASKVARDITPLKVEQERPVRAGRRWYRLVGLGFAKWCGLPNATLL